jgi:SAM-dependent methyltransferase
MNAWDTVHHWEWFRHEQWQGEFRDYKRHLSQSIAAALQALGVADGLVLDSTCGLGLNTITLHEVGLRVHGADGSALAVRHAQTLARAEGLEIPFFVSTWADLPRQAAQRFDAVFCDALPWISNRRTLLSALRGLAQVLKPGGALIFLGAPEGTTGATYRQALHTWWGTRISHTLDWCQTDGVTRCTKMTLGALGTDYVDWYQLFLIEQAGHQQFECVTIRESKRWHWGLLVALFAEAGFPALWTHAHEEWSPHGMPAGLNVATTGAR